MSERPTRRDPPRPVRWIGGLVRRMGERRFAAAVAEASTLAEDREPFGASAGQRRRPRVFVTYAYESKGHEEDVLRLCQLLCENGVDARLDKWAADRRRDWGEWMREQIDRADFVLAVASPGYRRAGDGDAASDEHRGVQAEAALLRDRMQEDRAKWREMILPVVLPGGRVADIPSFLQPFSGTHYAVQDFTVAGAEDLLRVVTRQPPYRPPLPGRVPVFAPRVLDLHRATSSKGRAAYDGITKLEFCWRLGPSWPELCDYFEIEPYERMCFDRGREPRCVWEWLQIRGRLTELPGALRMIGRDDLVKVLDDQSRRAKQSQSALRWRAALRAGRPSLGRGRPVGAPHGAGAVDPAEFDRERQQPCTEDDRTDADQPDDRHRAVPGPDREQDAEHDRQDPGERE
jgi:hypothetical protein